MKTNNKTKGADRWSRCTFRVNNPKDRAKIEYLFQKSGMKNMTTYIRARLLDKNFSAATTDANTQRFCDQLAGLIYQINKIGVNYNQTVHSINTHHGLNVSQLLLKNLSSYTQLLNKKMDEIIELEKELRQYCIIRIEASDET